MPPAEAVDEKQICAKPVAEMALSVPVSNCTSFFFRRHVVPCISRVIESPAVHVWPEPLDFGVNVPVTMGPNS